MANKDHLIILEHGGDAWDQWRRQHPRTIPDLSEAQLNGADLRRINFQGVNLCGANLRSAHLIEANLRKADLFGAALCQANLSQATLQKANLFGANLWGVNLQRANLTGANLYSANLRRANVSQARLVRASCKRATFEGALLTGAYCAEVDLTGTDLTHQDLETAHQGNVIVFTETSVPQETFSQVAVNHLCETVQAFMTACGFTYKETIETSNSPFFQLVKFWSKHPGTVDEVDRLYEAGQKALQNVFANLQDETSASRLQTVSTRLIAAIAPFENALLRLGELLVLKLTMHRQSHLCVETISPDLAHELTMNPSLFQKLEEALSFAIKVRQCRGEMAG